MSNTGITIGDRKTGALWGLNAICSIVFTAVLLILVFSSAYSAESKSTDMTKLPPGYVRGDVISYSYVPNRYWGKAEGYGICPYLFEYGLMKWTSKELAPYHKENIRRIDMVSRWSTAIQLYNRRSEWNDEIINLMIRCFKHKQLIILSARPNPGKPDKDSFISLIEILEKLWANRDKEFVSPEGDRATGQQLINNILAADLGDEGLAGLKTEGLSKLNERFKNEIQNRYMDGKRPFSHIKSWYNEIHYNLGSFAANEEDLAKGRNLWPANSEFIGVDVYHYWWFEDTPFDPDDPAVTKKQIADHAAAWQNVITRYHGPDFKVTMNYKFEPEHSNDTHAMLQGIDLAGADRAMMIFIANSQYYPGCYTTPIETMDAFYDSIKAGPWVGLSWWIFDTDGPGSSLSYIEKTLKHFTKEHPKGLPYTEEQLESYSRRFIESRMRMFNDVVYNQFGYLNGPKPKSVKK
ncbi:MAG: hypothetical protein ACOX9E_16260 [Lentisphaeria bacterium]|jgi:hypothetical protein